jgi:hypothetical protein
MHIVDDYYLQAQGTLASMKQKEWWEKNAPDKLYKYDYIVALIMHSFSWAFMIMIIPTIYHFLNTDNWFELRVIGVFLANVNAHAYIDNEKANKKTISLIGDQLAHIAQILITWLGFMIIT